MEPNATQEMIDTTDSLEAVSVMKGMKNFVFWVLLAALVVLQIVFWMHRGGLIDPAEKTAVDTGVILPAPPVQPQPAPELKVVPLAAPNVIAEQVEQVVQKVGLPEDAPAAEPTPTPTPAPAPPTPVDLSPDTPKPTVIETIKDKEMEFLKISAVVARRLIRAANFIAFMAAVLYCLTLLMNLKISLTGKLGGINHITRAFFCSLFLLAVLTPWQTLLPGVVIGAIYLPAELLGDAWSKAATSGFWKTLLYLRFVGLWLVVVWLLVCAQMRSIKWARATLRRLGMAR